MKSRNGSAAIVIFVIVLVLVVVGVIAWMHYSSQSSTSVETTASSTPTSVATTTQTPTTTTPTAVASSTPPSTNTNFIASLEACSKGSGTIMGETVLTDNGSPTVYVDYNVSVNILGAIGQNCSFTIRNPQIVSFTETALGKQQATAPAAQVQADMQASMSQAPTATCAIPQSSLASAAASFTDPTKFDAFVNSSACGS